jgi:hypothetical protein
MVHATERKLRKKENAVPQPEPSTNFPKTQLALCLSGVRTSKTIQMAMEAKILIGANQRSIWWRVLVWREEITPNTTSMAIDAREVCAAVLFKG